MVDQPHQQFPARCTTHVQWCADGSATLWSEDYQQTYHSHYGALTESLHVFIELSGLRAHLEARRPVRVLEIGLGTGLNLALALRLAREHDAPLSYETWEFAPPGAETLAALAYGKLDAVGDEAWSDVTSIICDLSERWSEGRSGSTRSIVPHWRAFEPDALRPLTYDIILHDGFSPDANPELWSEDALRAMAGALRIGGVMTTYTVKGSVRRALQQVGLVVTKAPGPQGGKREVLVAHRPEPKRI